LTDITYVATGEGWLYLAGHKDLFNGEIVGYAIAERMSKHLVCQSMFRAAVSKRPPRELIVHSDCGGQYCSHEYPKQMIQFGARLSMSSLGICFDNAPMESFWVILKSELVHHRQYATRLEV
jgi:putative transposase